MGAAAAAPRRVPASAREVPATKSRSRPQPERRSPQRRSTQRRSPQSRAAAGQARTRRRRPNPALAGAARLPHAAVRTAGAVRDISDSSLIVRLTQGRGWIAVLGALLFGIVALNVISLSLNAGNGRIGVEIDAVERSNSALRAELAEQFSASRIESAAAELGLAVPDPRDIQYVDANDDAAAKLAKLLGTEGFLAGEFEPTEYADAGEATYSPTVIPESDVSAAPAPEPSASPAPAAPAAPAPSSGGGGTGGTGGIGL